MINPKALAEVGLVLVGLGLVIWPQAKWPPVATRLRAAFSLLALIWCVVFISTTLSVHSGQTWVIFRFTCLATAIFAVPVFAFLGVVVLVVHLARNTRGRNG